MLTIPVEVENYILGKIIIHLNIDQIIFWCEEYSLNDLEEQVKNILIEVSSGEVFKVYDNNFGYKRLLNYLKDNDTCYQEEPLCE